MGISENFYDNKDKDTTSLQREKQIANERVGIRMFQTSQLQYWTLGKKWHNTLKF